MKHTYVILSDNRDEIAETKAVVSVFPQMSFVGSAQNYEDGLDLILDKMPQVVFLEIQPEKADSKLGLNLISELYRYLSHVPEIIVTAKNSDLAYEALRYEVLDYLITPFRSLDLRKTLLRFEKGRLKPLHIPTIEEAPILLPIIEEVATEEEVATLTEEPEVLPIQEMPQPVMVPAVKEEKPLIICVKSYGDYRFIEAKDICYLQADNNSTDIHLNNGEMITAFKTLKHFENVLQPPFVRIHNSYIVNIDYVSRIHTGNAVCYIKNSSIKLPFSKSYKENVDSIISSISNGNYLEF
ncbi:response regulator transcription factor [Flavobacterium sp. MAH-1]|uniref:Response regulator transcription factor n=1 Tax=Flavobacterium agri TaxID=2743471 RepID=A0A7Y9C7H6_9FLAO|nr:LytTR family DNA-binding domain-containing protein [Flavobacterium agri]NUY81348.1 response regulator transcription factor [Flavobacterium agri]NYA71372.1 response regulator transcription factor [Flavobacterium agri]